MWLKQDCTYTDFIATVSIEYERLYKHMGWSYGKTFFLLLRRKNILLAEEIRGTNLDPYGLTEIAHEQHLELEKKWNEHNEHRPSRQNNR
jgi:hypothetical protein